MYKGEIIMFKQIADAGTISLAILESVLATKICNLQDNKAANTYFNKFDQSTFAMIENEIKDQFEKEQVHDFIAQNSLLQNHRYSFITNKAKSKFIDKFYNDHPDLRYIGSEKITICLEQYIEKINDLLNDILSTEGRIIIQQINSSENSITSEIQNSKQEVISTIKDSISSINEKQNLISQSRFYNIDKKNKLFYGRVQIIDDILLKLSEDNLVFLTGLSGIGKSQIAREIAFRSQSKYELIMWFPANTEIELLNEFNNAAISYGLINESNENFDYVKSILSIFIDKYSSSLIVYDGADDISIEFLTEKCCFISSDIIVTTQNSNIDIDEFSVVPIDPFTPEEAQSFLMTCSNNRKHTELDTKTVSDLCNLLENIPLALEYARAYVNKTQNSFAEYMEIYREHKFDILKTTISRYKKTAYTAWKISYDKIIQLSKDAKDILSVLSFLDTYDIPLHDIFILTQQYTLDRLNPIILNIKNYSLLTTHNGFANMHGITQEFIRLQMQEDREYQSYYEKTIQIFSKLMPDQITSASEKDLVNRITKHAIQLISYNCKNNDKDILHFTANIASKLYILGYYTQTIKFIKEQIELYDSSTQNFDLLQMIAFIAQAYHYTGEDDNALNLLKKYYFIASSSKEISDSEKWQLLSRYKNVEGIIQKDQGAFSICLETFFESLGFLNNLCLDSDYEIKSNILINIGIAYKHLGQYDNALKYYNQAMSCSNNDKHLLLRICGNIATVYKELNQIDSALKYFEICLNYCIELGDKRNECICLSNLGDYCINLHQYDNAALYLKKSVQIANEINFFIGGINAYYNLGRLAFFQENYIEAKKYWKLSLEKSYIINYKSGIDRSNNALSQLPK